MLLTEGKWLIQSVLVGVAISSAAWLLTQIITFAVEWWEKLNPPCDLPILNLKGWRFDKAKQEYVTRLDHYLDIGRSKYRETGYQLWSPEGYKIILPPRFYEEAGIQNDDVMSNEAARLRILGGYNVVGGKGYEFTDTITVTKKHMQGSLAPLGNEPSELMQAHIFAQFPQNNGKEIKHILSTVTANNNPDWTELVFFPKLLAVIAATNTTILFGKELAQDPKILQAATTFPMDIITAGLKLRRLTYPFKVLAVELGLMPEAVKVRSWIKYTRKVVPTTLRAREQASQNDPTYRKPNDFIQWLYDSAIGPDSNRSVDSLGPQTLFAMSAAVHTTSMNLVNVIHHIAWFPEHNDALREEIDRVWAGSNGNINSSNAAQLDKLDSYIMEASRHGNFKRSKISSASL
jgi:Cytochrome P450